VTGSSEDALAALAFFGLATVLRRPGAQSALDAHAFNGKGNLDAGGFVSTFYPRPEPKYIFCVHVICHVYQLCQAAMQHAPSRWRLMFREAASA